MTGDDVLLSGRHGLREIGDLLGEEIQHVILTEPLIQVGEDDGEDVVDVIDHNADIGQ